MCPDGSDQRIYGLAFARIKEEIRNYTAVVSDHYNRKNSDTLAETSDTLAETTDTRAKIIDTRSEITDTGRMDIYTAAMSVYSRAKASYTGAKASYAEILTFDSWLHKLFILMHA